MRTLRSGRGLHNVPAELTSFVGRRRELDQIKQRLGASRLVTLTGPGGVGKSRLALRAATEIARAFPDGAWLVPLAPIEDPQLVAQAVFDALGLQDRSAGWSLSTLTDYLARKHLLLILDNCDHLLDSCAVLASTLLESCPELRILATSRQAMGALGEVRIRVPPLSLPEDGRAVAIDGLLDFDAVALFSERAVAVLPDFRVDEGNVTEVLRLCGRLDGIPLALELAAVRLEGLGLHELNLALDAQLPLLAQGSRAAEARHRTLEATIDWSYSLLDEQERQLWARVSVFAGSFDQEAAVEVCLGPALTATRIVELLASLVEKSILQLDGAIEPARYVLLETLRHYGQQRLREMGDEIELQARHRDWIFGLAKAAGAWDRRQAEAFERIYLERDNVWAALDFCLKQKDEARIGIEICRHLSVYWQCRGPHRDARRVLAALLEQTPGDPLSQAYALMVASSLAMGQNDFPEAGRLATESLRVAGARANAELVAEWLMRLSLVTWAEEKTTVALGMARSALALARAMDSRVNVLNAMDNLCAISLAAGDPDGAIALGEEAVAKSRESGELWIRGYVLNSLSQAKWQRGEPEHAEVLARDGAVCKHALGDQHGLAIVVDTLAWMAAERGAAARAATMLGCAKHLRETVGSEAQDPFRAQRERAQSAAREQLGDAGFTVAFDYGRAMTIEAAVAYALDQKLPTKPQPAAAAVETATPLTRREQAIATLVAEGLSNKQLAAKMVISERTAESHILNILNKLGFNSRSQIASWATARMRFTSIKS